MIAIEEQARRFLNTLVLDAYTLAAGGRPRMELPTRFLSDPQAAHAVFRAPEAFYKSYGFLDLVSRGRLSANGDDWKARVALTQPFYARATALVGEAEMEAVYRRQLRRAAAGAPLFQVFVDAGAELISRGFGLSRAIPWPAESASTLRDCVGLLQALSYLPHSGAVMKAIEARIKRAVAQIRASWRDDADVQALLADWRQRAGAAQEFEAEGELIQGLLASTETTASALMWALAWLAHHPEHQDTLDPPEPALGERRRDLFLKELVRLYPPIPLVARACARPTQLAGWDFAQGEVLFVSIIALHCNAAYWQDPFEFRLEREEFVRESYERMVYLPFLAGPRVCGGMKLAQAELRAGLRVFLGQYRLLPIPRPVTIAYSLTSRPAAETLAFCPREQTAPAVAVR